VKVRETGAAAAYTLLGCEASLMQVPELIGVAVTSETVHTVVAEAVRQTDVPYILVGRSLMIRGGAGGAHVLVW
jgi:hypothetical protein